MSISSRASSVMTSVIAAPVYELTGARLARARRASLERAHALLGADDAVDLDEDGRLGGVLRVLDRGRPGEREPRPVAGQDEAPVLVAQRTQHVANTGVDRERPVREPAGERLVVDRMPVVEGTDPAVALRLVEQDLVHGRLVPWVGLRSHPPCAFALDLGDRPEREVQNLEGMPGAQGKEARRLGVVVPALRSRLSGCARCAIF